MKLAKELRKLINKGENQKIKCLAEIEYAEILQDIKKAAEKGKFEMKFFVGKRKCSMKTVHKLSRDGFSIKLINENPETNYYLIKW